MTITYDGYVMEVDVDATRQAYARIKSGHAQACSCLDCKNFAFARARGLVFPPDALDLFERLGIDPACEAEVFISRYPPEVQDTKRLYCYSGWFNLVGVLIEDRGGQAEWTGRDPFRVWVGADGMCQSQAFGRQPTCRLEFDVLVPWLLPPEDGLPFIEGRSS